MKVHVSERLMLVTWETLWDWKHHASLPVWQQNNTGDKSKFMTYLNPLEWWLTCLNKTQPHTKNVRSARVISTLAKASQMQLQILLGVSTALQLLVSFLFIIFAGKKKKREHSKALLWYRIRENEEKQPQRSRKFKNPCYPSLLFPLWNKNLICEERNKKLIAVKRVVYEE